MTSYSTISQEKQTASASAAFRVTDDRPELALKTKFPPASFAPYQHTVRTMVLLLDYDILYLIASCLRVDGAVAVKDFSLASKALRAAAVSCDRKHF